MSKNTAYGKRLAKDVAPGPPASTTVGRRTGAPRSRRRRAHFGGELEAETRASGFVPVGSRVEFVEGIDVYVDR
jgi:hypothetical protein